LLLFDGRAIWLHSMNSPEKVLALYDFMEQLLHAAGPLPVPPSLAEHHFSASSWEARPDGLPVEDRQISAVPGAQWTCPTYLPAEVKASATDRVIADMEGPGAMPRKNGELVFEAPWEGRAFGMVVTMYQRGLFEWDEFRDRLIAAIATAEARGEQQSYYESWLAAFETLMTDKGVLARPELDERTEEFEFGERDEVF
jgi:nitrile hydratase accessory protein